MNRAHEDDAASQVSEAGTITRDLLEAGDIHPQPMGSDAEDDWDIVAKPQPTPEIGDFKDADAMAASFSSAETAQESPAPPAEQAFPRGHHEDMFHGAQDEEEEEEESNDGKPMPTEEEEEDDVREFKPLVVESEDSELDNNAAFVEESVPVRSPSSPIVHENYLSRVLSPNQLVDLDEVENASAAAPILPLPEFTDSEDEMLTIVEALRITPPLEETQAAQPVQPQTPASRRKINTETFTTYVMFIALLYAVCSLILKFLSSDYFAAADLANEQAEQLNQADPTFRETIAQVLTSCEGSCCFNLFIFTGERTAHASTLDSAVHSVSSWKGGSIKTWSTEQLMDWTEGSGKEKLSRDEAILIEHANNLTALQIQRAIKFGRFQCRLAPLAPSRKIVVLSTSFGQDKVQNPDEFMEDSPVLDELRQRDWLVLPEILLNPREVVHHIRGQSALDFYRKLIQTQSIVDWPAPRVLVNATKDERFNVVLRAMKGSIALTENARRAILRRTSVMCSPQQTLNWWQQYMALWTNKYHCQSVVFSPNGLTLRALPVRCNSNIFLDGIVEDPRLTKQRGVNYSCNDVTVKTIHVGEPYDPTLKFQGLDLLCRVCWWLFVFGLLAGVSVVVLGEMKYLELV